MRAVHVASVSRGDVRLVVRNHGQAVLGGGRGDALQTGTDSAGLQHLPQRLTFLHFRLGGHTQLDGHLGAPQTLDGGVVLVCEGEGKRGG